MDLVSPNFWTSLGSIIVANLLLSGDNAVIIALAARQLPPHRQRQAVVLGGLAAILMRIVLTIVAVRLLDIPGLKLVGGLLLLWIGVRLLLQDTTHGPADAAPASVADAVRTILLADLVMSLDNVLAVAAAAQGSWTLLVIGLVLSVPLIVFGSTLLMKVMERLPWLIDAGAALLGWLAGTMIVEDPGLRQLVGAAPEGWTVPAGLAGAVLVVLAGRWMRWRAASRHTP